MKFWLFKKYLIKIECPRCDATIDVMMNISSHIDKQRVREVFMNYRKYSPTIIDDMMEELGLLEDE